jgi:hypothetical protein
MIAKIKFALWSQCMKSVLRKPKSDSVVSRFFFLYVWLSSAFAFFLRIWTFTNSSCLVFAKIYTTILKRSVNTREGTPLPKYWDVEVKWDGFTPPTLPHWNYESYWRVRQEIRWNFLQATENNNFKRRQSKLLPQVKVFMIDLSLLVPNFLLRWLWRLPFFFGCVVV